MGNWCNVQYQWCFLIAMNKALPSSMMNPINTTVHRLLVGCECEKNGFCSSVDQFVIEEPNVASLYCFSD
jgi:hypothetical protein